MATYAIGDIQGCYDSLQRLLELIRYDSSADKLWFAGDLVNRGPNSLAVLRLISKLPNIVSVLGNHDLHLLALANGEEYTKHTLEQILQAADREELIHWVRHCPLLHYDPEFNTVLVHAGIPPQWSLDTAQKLAKEVERIIQSEEYIEFLQHMYGNEPDLWSETLTNYDRARYIINAFTRMRFCTAEGKLEFSHKGKPAQPPLGFQPWFTFPHRKTKKANILFGHWAALEGNINLPHLFALDTGCIWGRQLSALRLDDQKWFRVDCHFIV